MGLRNNNKEQNGRQPPLPGVPPPLRAENRPQIRNFHHIIPESEKKEICRDFIWGTCTKTTHCRHRHELDFEEMKNVLKFCHDHQNHSGCRRDNCTYLHTTKEEQNLFLATGLLPPVLAERHAKIMAATATAATAETIPQIALFIKESYGTAPRALPPPPPPPPLPADVMTTTTATPTTKSPATTPAAVTPAAPPPPDTGSSPVPASFPGNQAKVQFPMFDASRPPPPLPPFMQTKTGANKHKLSPSQAGPSKRKKPEDCKEGETQCSNCILIKTRMDETSQKESEYEAEEALQDELSKREDHFFQNNTDLLKSLVNTDVYGLLDCAVLNDALKAHMALPASTTSAPELPKQFIMRLLEQLLIDPKDSASTSSDKAIENKSQQVAKQTSAVPGHLYHTFMDLMSNPDASAESAHDVISPFTNIVANTTNGYAHNNSPNADVATAVTRVSSSSSSSFESVQHVSRMVSPSSPNGGQAHAHGGAYSGLSYPMNTPPTRPFLPPNYPGPHYPPNMGFFNNRPMVPPYPMVRATSQISAVLPVNTNKNGYPFMVPRQPPPHFYPPFQ